MLHDQIILHMFNNGWLAKIMISYNQKVGRACTLVLVGLSNMLCRIRSGATVPYGSLKMDTSQHSYIMEYALVMRICIKTSA